MDTSAAKSFFQRSAGLLLLIATAYTAPYFLSQPQAEPSVPLFEAEATATQPAKRSGTPSASLSVPVIIAPDTVEPGDLVILDASQSTNAEQFAWTLANSSKTYLPVENGRKVVFSSGTPGNYTFVLATAGKDTDGNIVLGLLKKTLRVGDPEPDPPGPGPGPGPKPPDPKPVDPPAPVSPMGEGLKVLFIEDTTLRMQQSAIVRSTMSSNALRELLTSRCSKTNNVPNWRFFSVAYTPEQLANEDPDLKAGYLYVKAQRAASAGTAGAAVTVPWVIISNGKILYCGPVVSEEHIQGILNGKQIAAASREASGFDDDATTYAPGLFWELK